MHSYNALAVTLHLRPSVDRYRSVDRKIYHRQWIFYKGSALFGNTALRRSVVPLEIASVIYNSIIGPLGFFGTISWKGSKS